MAAIIKVNNLGKQYRLGAKNYAYATLREALMEVTRAPFNRLRSNGSKSSDREKIFWALRDVNFEVEPGEILGIIGRNGAGKSTLLKILSRITEPTTGTVKLYGRVGSLLEVGTGFHPELTGRENIYLNGALLGMRREEIASKFDEIVAFAEIEKFLDTPVKRYSSGMYVRLAFAVAAHLESEILIIDEVLAVGDTQFQSKCLGKMGEVARGGRTILLVSHNLGVVNSLCTKAIYLTDGRLRAEGPPDRIISEYLSETMGNKHHDLDRLRVGKADRVKFVDIALVSGDDSNLKFGEPLELLLTILAEENVKNLTIGSSLFNIAGNCVGSLITSEEFSVREGEKLVLRLKVSGLNLAPGSYYCGFSIGQGGGASRRVDHDSLVGVPSFQVLPVSEHGDVFANWHLSWGSVVFKEAQLTIEST